eukprot:1136551-Pelagomonas_calceolata.AAC.3
MSKGLAFQQAMLHTIVISQHCTHQNKSSHCVVLPNNMQTSCKLVITTETYLGSACACRGCAQNFTLAIRLRSLRKGPQSPPKGRMHTHALAHLQQKNAITPALSLRTLSKISPHHLARHDLMTHHSARHHSMIHQLARHH